MKKFLVCCMVIGFFSACRKDASNEFVPYPNLQINDTTWANKQMSQGLLDSMAAAFLVPSHTDTFNSSTGRKIVFSDSLQIAIPGGACTATGSSTALVNTTIQVELLALRRKGDFVRFQIPTTAGKYLLESGGDFFVRFTNNGQEVGLTQGATYSIRIADSLPQTAMSFYMGVPLTNRDSSFTWQASTDGGNVALWDSTSNGGKKGYVLASKLLHWTGINLLTDTTAPKTRINVTLALNFTNKNTLVFAVAKNKRTVIKLSPDFPSRSYYAQNVQTGTAFTILSISLIDHDFYVGTRDITFTGADKISVSPQKKSASDIMAILDAL